VDYPTLSALNPHLPPEPEVVKEPEKPETGWRWRLMSDDEKKQAQGAYQAAVQRRMEYEQDVKARLQSPEFLAAPNELAKTVRDLERRSLLQYDRQTKRHDLHPVVRGVAAGDLQPEDRNRYGQRVVDHFSQQAHRPYEDAEALEDVRYGLHVIRALLQMGRYQDAYGVYWGDLSNALLFNLEASAEVLTLLRPFFPQGWAALPHGLDESSGGGLANTAAMALGRINEDKEALATYGAVLRSDLARRNSSGARAVLSNIGITLGSRGRLADQERCLTLALDLAALIDKASLFRARFIRFFQLAEIGRWGDAEAMWQLLNPMGRDWSRNTYRPGNAEEAYAWLHFWKGDLREEHLTDAEELAKAGKNRFTIRNLYGLRGEWRLGQGQWALAVDSLHEAVRMAREVRRTDAKAEAQLALAKFHLGQLPEPRHEAEQLSKAAQVSNGDLAALWLALGDRERAEKHALAAYQWAWADGEPYVFRYALNKTRALLEQLGADIPNLPPYDPANAEKLPWEDEVADAIAKLRAEKEAEGRKEQATPSDQE
jgi:hypothetical protein